MIRRYAPATDDALVGRRCFTCGELTRSFSIKAIEESSTWDESAPLTGCVVDVDPAQVPSKPATAYVSPIHICHTCCTTLEKVTNQ